MRLRTSKAGKLFAYSKECHSNTVFHKQLARKQLSKKTALGKAGHYLESTVLAQ